MSSAGISPLAFFDPELYAKQLAIQRRLQLGQALMTKGEESSGAAPYGGLANMGRELLGAYLTKKSDEENANLFAPSSAATPTPGAMPSAPAMGGGAPSPAANPVSGTLPSAPSGGAPAPQAQGGDASGLPPQLQQLYANIPKIPGMQPTTAVQLFLSDNQGYMKAYMDSIAQTPEMKNIAAAYGAGSPQYTAALQATIAHGAATNVRPGGFLYNPLGPSFGVPNNSGITPTMLPNGQMGATLAPGAGAALAQSNYASSLGAAGVKPAIGYDPNGMPSASNAAVMSGNGPALNSLLGGLNAPPQGMPPGNPTMQARAPMPIPPPQGAVPVAPPQPMLPELPAGQADLMKAQGVAAGGRYTGTITEAEGSPDRQNVLNNIIQLSQAGTTTGPGSPWIAHMQGLFATLFPHSSIAGDANKYQELTKFAYQNAIRAWQTAGGTGTDNQMEVQMHANVNNEMNPGALQSIARWALAGEHAVMGKANAQTAWMAAHGNTPASQTAFENVWRNAMDRRVFILQGLTPIEQKAYVQSLSPADAAEIVRHRQQLRVLGAF